MSRKGECLDNAVAESFFGTLKAELFGDQPDRCFESKRKTLELVRDYIDNFYNSVRRHSALGYKSPVAFELAHRLKLFPLLLGVHFTGAGSLFLGQRR